jgi:hypothetical protein
MVSWKIILQGVQLTLLFTLDDVQYWFRWKEMYDKMIIEWSNDSAKLHDQKVEYAKGLLESPGQGMITHQSIPDVARFTWEDFRFLPLMPEKVQQFKQTEIGCVLAGFQGIEDCLSKSEHSLLEELGHAVKSRKIIMSQPFLLENSDESD